MKIVMVESPFEPSADVVAQYRGRYSRAELLRQNLVYARLCLTNAIGRGETPLASHLLYSQVEVEQEVRDKAAAEMYNRADLAALYVDLGVSEEMREAQEYAKLLGVDVTRRMLFADADTARARLHERDLVTFPRLEELQAEEFRTRGKVGA